MTIPGERVIVGGVDMLGEEGEATAEPLDVGSGEGVAEVPELRLAVAADVLDSEVLRLAVHDSEMLLLAVIAELLEVDTAGRGLTGPELPVGVTPPHSAAALHRFPLHT